MKKIIFIFLLLSVTIAYGQKTKKDSPKSIHYISLKSYKKLYGNNLTKKDSLKWIIRDNDTLIAMFSKKPWKRSVPYELKDSSFLEIYKDIVYKKYSNKDTTQRRKSYMRLWNQPIKIFFSKSVDERYKKMIERLSATLTKEVDSLSISTVSDIEHSNYIVYQIDDGHSYKYSKNIRNNKYIKYYSYWKKNRIYDTKFEINVTKFKNKQTNINYIIQYFLRSIGHFNGSSKVPCNSIFSTCNSDKKRFRKEDLEIIKYHYSYGICKFTDLAMFEKTHKMAKEEFKRTGNYPKFIN